jgi:SSS family solute:Na+ symporter
VILAVLITYLVVVLLVGILAHRLFRGTGEDYFLASRTIGPFVLLMTLFGTNMTAFTMLGASGQSYREGIIVFALMGSGSALVIPLVIYFVGTRLWWVGKREGYLTQVQFFRERYQSDVLGLVLFVILAALMLPYVLIGVKGGGDALQAITGGPDTGVPSWLGSLLICGVVFAYVTYGGMRSTAWANTFQTLVFMIVGGVSFFVILSNYGGLEVAMERLGESHPDLVVISNDRPTHYRMFSFLFLPLSVGVFPHIFSHWLSARDARAFRHTVVWYPLCIAAVWVPSVVLGAIGTLDYPPPLDGPILVKLILGNAGGVLAGCLGAGLFAAIMSSLDSQTLATGTMFTQDIVRHYGFHDRLSERLQILFGRIFIMGLLTLAFLFSQVTTQSIFAMGVWSLTGYTGLFPVVVAALFWKRSTKHGVLAAVLTVAVLWSYFFGHSLGRPGDYTVGGTGILPVVVILLGASLVLVVGSWLTRPPDGSIIAKFFPESSAASEVDEDSIAPRIMVE